MMNKVHIANIGSEVRLLVIFVKKMSSPGFWKHFLSVNYTRCNAQHIIKIFLYLLEHRLQFIVCINFILVQFTVLKSCVQQMPVLSRHYNFYKVLKRKLYVQDISMFCPRVIWPWVHNINIFYGNNFDTYARYMRFLCCTIFVPEKTFNWHSINGCSMHINEKWRTSPAMNFISTLSDIYPQQSLIIHY